MQPIDIATLVLYNSHAGEKMIEIKVKHYTDTVIHAVDLIIKSLKSELKQKVDNLGIGITGEQFVVLDTICHYPGIHQQKLSEILMKDKSNTTRILGVLEKKGLITRSVGRKDNRLVNLLNISPEGRRKVEDNMPQIKEFITDIFKNINDKEIETLHALSKKFQKDLSILPQ